MTDIKISQLPAATLPLAGTEVAPIVQSGVTVKVAVSQFGGGGGGNDITTQQTISSGSAATAVLNQIIIFNSASGAAKTIIAPASTGSLSVIEAVDKFGDAFTNPISFAPVAGSVIGGNNQIYTDYGSARWRDTAAGWANV